MRSSTTALLVVTALLACSDVTGPGPLEPITELPRALTESEARVLGASNAFAFDLAKELLPAEPDENLFFSPISASMLLGMILNGADGNTLVQMREMLGLEELSQVEINQGYHDLTELLLGLDPSVTTEIGNSVWSHIDFPISPDFRNRVASSFGAEAREVNLGSPAGLDAINGWASDATNGRIETIFDELPANVVMVLLNAIYFKANWTTQFDRADTEPAPFSRPDGSQVTVDMMSLESDLRWTNTADGMLVDLPYGGGAFTMTVVVPNEGATVNDMVEGLDRTQWDEWTDEMREGHVNVQLPRMEIEWEAELNDMLIALGMEDAFSSGATPADFSRLTPGGGVALDLVKQKAFVKVDEAGTEAAAVSGGTFVDSGPPTLRADRPFLFVVRERLTGAVLFLGVVNDPTA